MTNSCAHCSSALDEGSGACPQCGTEAVVDSAVADTAAADATIFKTVEEANDPRGIGGWLIVPAISLVVAPCLILRALVISDLPFLFANEHQEYLESHPINAALVLFEATSNVVLIAMAIFLNYQFFGRKRAFPQWMILYIVLRVCVFIADHMAAGALHPGADHSEYMAQIVAVCLWACIWIPYFLVSRRVKATFVN